MTAWGEFANAEPDLAAFGAARLVSPPAYLATVRADGTPRVHPVTPVFTDDGMYVFMEPTSPKGADLRERGAYALHNGVPDNSGTGGEFSVRGTAAPVTDPDVRVRAVAAATFDPAEHYVLFELAVAEARCHGYGDVPLPATRRWRQQTAIEP